MAPAMTLPKVIVSTPSSLQSAFMWKMASRSRMQQLIHRAIVSNSGRTPSPA